MPLVHKLNEPGTSIFPMSRVKRIIKEDKSVSLCSKEAVFLIAKATEFFIKSIASDSVELSKARVVDRVDKYFFLVDIIPPTVPLSTIEAPNKETE
ncbi:hypothetical protein BB560_006971 [Smittium megazygosporum]|uniref:Transcription factor CBF/NF-Y/archaeal histone domain-containing protein n=1 Tax=Smittium megazygosporum TaxID=133381 RepID=A0A2T9XZT1_9FUNG|nr:hypothetical protein BB560_006971 [Smittium megazygosporum]